MPAPSTAAEVKEKLRRRHPAYTSDGILGEWTVLEEWANVDLLAISAWGNSSNVGYEVKVSRSDYRRELLRPDKRLLAVSRCHEFWLAVPEGLLTAEEIEYEQPTSWTAADFQRQLCPGIPSFGAMSPYGRTQRYGGRCRRRRTVDGPKLNRVPVPAPVAGVDEWGDRLVDVEDIVCPTCQGKGHVELSVAERDAPTLWVPPDVGLIEVTARGCRVARKAPKRKPEQPFADKAVAQLLRWASVRPDPRHAAAGGARYERVPHYWPADHQLQTIRDRAADASERGLAFTIHPDDLLRHLPKEPTP